METDQQSAVNDSEGVRGDSSEKGDVSMGGGSDCEAKKLGNTVLLNIPMDNHVYREDVVRLNDGSLIGVVTEVAGDSDSESGVTDDDGDDDSDDSNEDEKEEDGKEEGAEETEENDGDVGNEGHNNAQTGETNKITGDSSSCDDLNRDSLSSDQVRVLWMDDSETTHHRNELTVVDRGFMHGDYVASALDPTGQVGLVVDVNMTVDLSAPGGSTIQSISSRYLKRVRDVSVGDYVVSGAWLGRVDDVLDNVTVLFDDGSICKILKAEPLRLRPTAKNMLEDGHCPYHPGQRVRASSSSVFKDGKWLLGRWKAKRLEGTVMKVTVGTVYVNWIAAGGNGPGSNVSPDVEQNPKDLTLLSCFSHANWQLGDWCLLPLQASSSAIPLDKGLSKLQLQESDSSRQEHDLEEVEPEESNQHAEPMDLDCIDTSDGVEGLTQNSASPKSSSCSSSVSVSKENVQENRHIHRKKFRKVVVKRDKKLRKKEEDFKRALLIVNTVTKVDVAWQDGKVEQGLDSTSLIPVESPGDHDFVAEQYVIEKAVDDSEEMPEIRRVGVVKSVNAKEKTAHVNWLKQVTRPEDPREFEKEEIVSVYELEGHPDFDYSYGDVVVRLSPVVLTSEGVYSDSRETRLLSEISNVVDGSTVIESNDKGNALDEEACNQFSDQSWVGNITGLKNGDIEVTWADGMISTVGPQAIYVVGRDEDESLGGGSEISDAATWETVEGDEMDGSDNTEQSPDGTHNNLEAGEDDRGHNSGNGPLGFAMGLFRMASGIFSRGRTRGDSESSREIKPEEEIEFSDGLASSNVPNQDPGVINFVTRDTNLVEEEEPAAESTKSSEASAALCNLRPIESDHALPGGSPCSFKRFDTAKDPLDHFFLGAHLPSNSGRKWLKKVQRDWSILQNNLPDGIYVRVYEDRMDLLRAVIVGAYGTPYQDGLFFFDFHLPPEYPDVPPSAHYHSGGWRINPNLYEEGKVCLSLLNTWTGRGNEVWDPQSSSILQVLVSLQGLVLNSKPYFNEAGYDKQIGTAEGEKNSLSYNENTFLLNCKTIMYLIRKPPKDFEDLVKEHFMLRGYYILKACDAYMKGYLIGSLAKNALVTDKSEVNATSVGFKLMLAKIVPRLISSLSEVGADCHEFKHLQSSS